VPAAIFGKGDLEHMPFEQYAKYVGAQGYNLNTLVTQMRFDPDSDTAKLFFKPLKFLSREEWEAAKRQGDTPAAKSAIQLTVAQTDGVKPKLAAPAPKAEKVVAEAVEEPKKREDKKPEPTAKRDLKSVMSGWSTDDE
jgi:sRNA-binding carbon storage regulator CsrA